MCNMQWNIAMIPCHGILNTNKITPDNRFHVGTLAQMEVDLSILGLYAFHSSQRLITRFFLSIFCRIPEGNNTLKIVKTTTNTQLCCGHGQTFVGRNILILGYVFCQIWITGDKSLVLVLDFSKAFDTVPHKRLLQKLEFYGIQGEILSWIRSFLSARTQSVVVEGCRSPEDKVLSGVPKGTVFGPLLFLCHINDLPSVVDPQTAVRLFADDCLVYRSITSNSDHRQLQLDLQAHSHWGECWGMKFNVDKCHVLHIGRSGICGIRFYEMNQVFLSEVRSATYRGVLLSSDMSWSPHIFSIVHKAHQRLGFIRRNLRGSPFKYREIAYRSLVRSQLEYCATIWDPTLKCDITKLEQIQRKAARRARGEYGIVSVTRLLRDLGWDQRGISALFSSIRSFTTY